MYIFNRENPKNSEPQNGPRRGLDFIALGWTNLTEVPWDIRTFILSLLKKKLHPGATLDTVFMTSKLFF